MRAELGSWVVRGAGLAMGLAIVYGVVQLGAAAAGVLVLLFLAVLLASALEPVVDGLRARLPVGRGWSVLIVYAAFVQRYALAFLPAERRTGARDAWNEIESRLGGWVRGQLILMGVIGVATGIAYTLLGLPGALLLGLIAGIAEAVPMIGPLLGAIPAILVAATVSPELAVVVAMVYVALQLVEGYVLVPIVMRNTVGLSPFLVLASLLLGGAVAGVAGAFLAVPIVAAVEIVAARFQAREVPVLQDVSAVTGLDEPVAEAS